MGVLSVSVHRQYQDALYFQNVKRFHETRRGMPPEEKSVSGYSCKCVIEIRVETLEFKIINSSVCMHIYQSYIVQDVHPRTVVSTQWSRLANFMPVRIFYLAYVRMSCV